jgi:predicted N-acetyltransferase YhbS
MNYTITPQTDADAPAIETLIEAAFGPGRTQRTIHRFRDGKPCLREFGFVGRRDGETVASIRFWPAVLPGGETVPLLGPLAVLPDLRGLGMGRALVRHGLDAVRKSGAKAVLIVGDPGYYAPFGFAVEPVRALDIGGPVAPLTLMGIEFAPGTLSTRSGTVLPP